MTQGEDFGHHRAVIPFTGIRPLIGGAGAVGAVHLFAQSLVVTVGHYRQIARDIQRQQVTFLLFGFCLRFCRRQGAFRHSGQFGLVGDQFGPTHGGIQHVVAVLITQFRQTRGNLTVALLFVFRQANARQFKITQRVIDRFFLRGIQRRIMIAVAQIAIRLVQPFVLPNPGAVLRQQRQGLLVSFSQFRAVLHRVQVAYRGEDAPEHIIDFRQRLTQIFPAVGRALRHYALNRRAAIVQCFGDGWHDMFRLNGGKRRQRKRRQ
ncbi:hypothetical protein D3C75_256190 [compost metagenome]